MARKRNAPAANANRRIKGLIYGPPKHGKTHFLGTAAFDERTAPMLCGDLEGGVEDVLETMPGYGTDFVRHPIESWEDMNQFYDRLRQGDEGFKSAAIDSLSETHIFALMNLLEDGRPSREKNPDLIEQGDYGNCFDCGSEIAEKRLRALPFAVRCKDCEEAREMAEQRERQLAARRSTSSLFLDM